MKTLRAGDSAASEDGSTAVYRDAEKDEKKPKQTILERLRAAGLLLGANKANRHSGASSESWGEVGTSIRHLVRSSGILQQGGYPTSPRFPLHSTYVVSPAQAAKVPAGRARSNGQA